MTEIKKSNAYSDSPGYYVFVAADVERHRTYLPSGYEIARHRLAIEKWGLNTRTSHRRALKATDRVLIYVSGGRAYAQHFVGVCTLTSASRPSQAETRTNLDGPAGIGHMLSPFYVELGETHMFKQAVEVRKIAADLQFITNEKQWWRYLQGGVTKISKKDFDYVCRIGSNNTR